MIKKYKVTKQILAEACDKAWPFSDCCPVVRAIRVEYPEAHGSYSQISFDSDCTVVAKVEDEVKYYMQSFDRVAQEGLNDDQWNLSIEAREAIMNLPEFEFELEIN